MSMELNVFTSGLVFARAPELELAAVEKTLTPLLAARGTPLLGIVPLGAAGLQVSCEGLLIWIARDGLTPRLRITAQPAGSSLEGANAQPMDEDAVKALKAVVLAALARDLGASAVQWLSRTTEIPAAQFITAAGLEMSEDAAPQAETAPIPAEESCEMTCEADSDNAVMPRRIRPATAMAPRRRRARPVDARFAHGVSRRLAVIRATEEILADARDQKYSTPLRIAAWLMTALLAVFSVPLAWMLFAMNLRRGGDFRITTNVLAGTAGLSLLHATGATHAFVNILLG